MSASSPAKAALALSFGVLVASIVPEAGAQPRRTVSTCIAEFERAQRERASGRLQDARSSANRCINARCPAPIRKDCESLTNELNRAIPTFIFRVRDPSDSDVVEATITLDGKAVPGAVDGRAREVDPGPHEIEASASGFEPVRAKVVAEEGVRPRIIELRLSPIAKSSPSTERAAPPPPAATTKAPVSPETPSSHGPGGPTTGTWVASGALAAIGVVGIGLFAGFGLDADGDYNRLRGTCGDACPKDEIESVRSRYQVADIALVSGAVALAAAVVVLLVGPRAPATAARATPARWTF